MLEGTKIEKNLHLTTTILNLAANDDNKVEIRYVFDIGSGGTKSKAVLVDKATNKIINTVSETSVAMGYQSCISGSPDGRSLSEDCMRDGLASLFNIVSHYGFNSLKGLKCAGIATAWARNAWNGEDYIDLLNEYGFNIRIITQEEEGEVGFRAAEMYLGTDVIGKSLVWDIGGGSFQLGLKNQATQKIFIYEGEYGASNFNAAIKDLFAGRLIANEFLTMEQLPAAQEFARQRVSEPIKEFAQDNAGNIDLSNGVYGIGQMMNRGIKTLIDDNSISVLAVDRLIHEFAGTHLSHAASKYSEIGLEFLIQMQSNLILIKAIMDGLQIEEVKFLNAKSLDYVVFDTKYWSDDTMGGDYDIFVHIDHEADSLPLAS
ncbi:MAG: hypothetical protein ACHP6I_02355 [Rickettsiales bacterium]